MFLIFNTLLTRHPLGKTERLTFFRNHDPEKKSRAEEARPLAIVGGAQPQARAGTDKPVRKRMIYRLLSRSRRGVGAFFTVPDRSAFLPQSFGGAAACLLAPVLPQSFLAGATPPKPALSACTGVFTQSLAGTVCALAVARGASPFGAGDGAGVDTTSFRVGWGLGLAVSILRELSNSRFTGSSFWILRVNPKTMEGDFLGGAKRHTKWLDKRAMRNVLERSTFNLSDLKTGEASVYLVLPPDYLDNDGAFLRLFVRCAISAMARGGSGKGKRCLFILDEFFSLGKMDVIQKSSGNMPSYDVHLWPFLQDLGQLLVTYDPKGAETFFANADLHQFFGNFDPLTLNHVSQQFGSKTADEVRMPNAPSVPISSGASMGRGIASLGGFCLGKRSEA